MKHANLVLLSATFIALISCHGGECSSSSSKSDKATRGAQRGHWRDSLMYAGIGASTAMMAASALQEASEAAKEGDGPSARVGTSLALVGAGFAGACAAAGTSSFVKGMKERPHKGRH